LASFAIEAVNATTMLRLMTIWAAPHHPVSALARSCHQAKIRMRPRIAVTEMVTSETVGMSRFMGYA